MSLLLTTTLLSGWSTACYQQVKADDDDDDDEAPADGSVGAAADAPPVRASTYAFKSAKNVKPAARGRKHNPSCVESGASLIVSLDLSKGAGTFTEKILFEGDEGVALHDGGASRACDLVEGDEISMEQGLVGRVTGSRRRAKAPTPANSPGQARAEEVYATTERVVTTLLHLHTKGSDVDTTPEHPFFVAGRGFVKAADLKAGDAIVTRDGKASTVERSETEEVAPVKVYNLRVRNSPTYYVGKEALLVHNGGPCVPMYTGVSVPLYDVSDDTHQAETYVDVDVQNGNEKWKGMAPVLDPASSVVIRLIPSKYAAIGNVDASIDAVKAINEHRFGQTVLEIGIDELKSGHSAALQAFLRRNPDAKITTAFVGIHGMSNGLLLEPYHNDDGRQLAEDINRMFPHLNKAFAAICHGGRYVNTNLSNGLNANVLGSYGAMAGGDLEVTMAMLPGRTKEEVKAFMVNSLGASERGLVWSEAKQSFRTAFFQPAQPENDTDPRNYWTLNLPDPARVAVVQNWRLAQQPRSHSTHATSSRSYDVDAMANQLSRTTLGATTPATRSIAPSPYTIESRAPAAPYATVSRAPAPREPSVERPPQRTFLLEGRGSKRDLEAEVPESMLRDPEKADRVARQLGYCGASPHRDFFKKSSPYYKLHLPDRDACFVAGTQVALPGGFTEIEKVEPGSYVLAASGASGPPDDDDERPAALEPPRAEDVSTSRTAARPPKTSLANAEWKSAPLVDPDATEGHAGEAR